MNASLLKGLASAALAALVLSACSTETQEDASTSSSTTDDDLRSAPVSQSDMVEIDTPEGMPTPWQQPDSTGFMGAGGKCGPTALANELKLYDIDLSPEQADDAGVHWLVGTLQFQIDGYLKKQHPELGCRASYPWDGANALRGQLDGGHPVMVWFNIAGGFTSHWVVAVGHHGTGDDEKVVVMSWGRYYEIPMKKLDDASKWVLGLRHPTIICSKTTENIVR